MVRVRVAALLRSYTAGDSVVEVEGEQVGEVMAALDRRFPGLAFRVVDEQGRVRPHMNIFVGEELASGLETRIATGQEVYIVGALSGG